MYDFTKRTPINRIIELPMWFAWGVWIVGYIIVERLRKK
jgi:hypothetical protein